jgi:DNA-binding NarL/FixJ family response regulator
MRMRLLIVDDEHSIRFSLKKFFELRSFTVDAAATAAEARLLLAKERYDVVILDIRLEAASGDVTGLELIGEVRKHSPQARVVVLSGYLSPETLERAKGLQADLILNKPQPLAQLELAIKNVLAG